MFFELFMDGIRKYYLDDLYLIILFLGMMCLFHCTLVRKYNYKKTILGYLGLTLCLYISFRILFATQYTVFYTYQDFFQKHQLLYDIFYSFGIWMFFVQVVYLVVGAKMLYEVTTWNAMFSGVFYYLYVSLFADYVMPLTLVAVCPRVGSSGYYYLFEIGGGILYPIVGIMLAFVLFIIYKKYICRYIITIFSLPSNQMKHLSAIPIISCITYNVFYLLMSYVKVYPNTPDGILYFIVIFGTNIIVYTIMYIAMFFGIFSTIQTTKVKAELEIAAQIQKENLPDEDMTFECKEKVEIYGYMKTAFEVGGDFYDYFMIDENHVAFLIADVCGKGISSALFMMKAKTLIKNCSYYSKDPSEILTAVNHQLESDKYKMFLTVFLGVIDLTDGMLSFTSAGHNYPFYKQVGSSYELFIIKNDFILAGERKIKYHTNHKKLEKGDELFLYTDGITEAKDSKGILFGEKKLETILNSKEIQELPMSQKIDFIQKEIDKFTKNQQYDDITMLMLKVNESLA
ncbi:PP2C family protein-serine/threonine phosphatase [Lachnoclostridium phytofermentans]|uniref:PP2C family protein-serine/threonine phosphatase n=1 Tax=Lachnoclostridium phytofermentans TaxID=66219 RepID=UPI00068AC9EE|nr:PP2C family protein-serine/threonine phosphatase [Lachnoclostridium phytofermentans]